MNHFSRPCPDLIAPLLQELAWRYRCREWEAACKLMRISRLWCVAVRDWCRLVTNIGLDARTNKQTLLVIANACNQLQKLTLTSCSLYHDELAAGLAIVTKANKLLELNLIRCRGTCFNGVGYIGLWMGDWTKTCSSLEVLSLAGCTDSSLSDRDLLLMTRFRRLRALSLENCSCMATCGTLAVLIEKHCKTLEVLNVSSLSTVTGSPEIDWLMFLSVLGECLMLRELHMRGSVLCDAELHTVLESIGSLIRVLDLSETRITGDSFIKLADLPALERLCVQGTTVMTVATDQIGSLDNIWPKLGQKLRHGWGLLEFHRARPHDSSVLWYGPTKIGRAHV